MPLKSQSKLKSDCRLATCENGRFRAAILTFSLGAFDPLRPSSQPEPQWPVPRLSCHTSTQPNGKSRPNQTAEILHTSHLQTTELPKIEKSFVPLIRYWTSIENILTGASW